MLVRAIVIIPRTQGIFHLDQTEIYRSYRQFQGFQKTKVTAIRKGEGYGVALILEQSQVDADFGEKTVFLTEQQKKAIIEAFELSDKLTHELLGHGWNGERPYLKVEDFM